MRAISVLIILACFVGCTQKQSDKTQPGKPHQKHLAVFLDNCLQEQPNAMNNEVSRSILADTIQARFLKFQGDTLLCLSDIPMQYEMCLEYPARVFDSFEAPTDKNAGKYVVKFSFGEASSKMKLSEQYNVTFQAFAILEKEQVATLVDGALYHINGIFRDFANNSQETGFILPSGKCLVDYPEIIAIDGKPYIDLGTLILDNLSFHKLNDQ